jgi:hypothetical protein
MKAKPNGMTTENIFANVLIPGEYLLFNPILWKEEAKPCHR